MTIDEGGDEGDLLARGTSDAASLPLIAGECARGIAVAAAAVTEEDESEAPSVKLLFPSLATGATDATAATAAAAAAAAAAVFLRERPSLMKNVS